jgi:hypothetical protein
MEERRAHLKQGLDYGSGPATAGHRQRFTGTVGLITSKNLSNSKFETKMLGQSVVNG